MPTRKLRRLPREGTKDRAKLEAMRRRGGATQAELQDIDGNDGYGTYIHDCGRYAEFLGLECKVTGTGSRRCYELV
jgi:hypothetical protein